MLLTNPGGCRTSILLFTSRTVLYSGTSPETSPWHQDCLIHKATKSNLKYCCYNLNSPTTFDAIFVSGLYVLSFETILPSVYHSLNIDCFGGSATAMFFAAFVFASNHSLALCGIGVVNVSDPLWRSLHLPLQCVLHFSAYHGTRHLWSGNIGNTCNDQCN